MRSTILSKLLPVVRREMKQKDPKVWVSCPIKITEGNEEPKQVGDRAYWLIGTKKRYKFPKYYVKNAKYKYSTLTIIVGIGWLFAHWTEKQIQQYTTHRITKGQNNE